MLMTAWEAIFWVALPYKKEFNRIYSVGSSSRSMNPYNLILLVVGGGLAWLGWTTFGPGSTHPPPPVMESQELQAAIASGQPVLVDFYADWCGPCRAMKPTVHELEDELRGKLQVVQINVDQDPYLAQQYGVRGIPCFVVIKGGSEVGRQVGGVPKSVLRKLTGL